MRPLPGGCDTACESELQDYGLAGEAQLETLLSPEKRYLLCDDELRLDAAPTQGKGRPQNDGCPLIVIINQPWRILIADPAFANQIGTGQRGDLARKILVR
ncbi:MAG: hypothetical protein SGJ17_10370 [Hyphomicrobiales bacterium]|nr:hypothetical protein [Hyphomicrobiales bacterium]